MTSSKGQVAVVGAGAAGMTAAIRCAEAGARVTLLNAHPKVGLKILMSGGTRCNVSHREVTERDFNAGSRPFVARILRAFTAEQTREWMESLGVALKLEESGKYFPVSDDAQTVLDALLRACQAAAVKIESGARVVRLERDGDKAVWRLGIQNVRDASAFGGGTVAGFGEAPAAGWPLPQVTPGRWLTADAVVLACGGLSFPRTGSDGTGYGLAAALGHTIVPPVPALTPLAAEDRLCRSAQGVTLDAELALWVGGRRELAVRGSLLVTHFGYSGPAALDLSRHWLRAAGSGERRVTASFLPGENGGSLLRDWLEVAARSPKLTIRRYLGGRMPESLALELCLEASVHPSLALSQMDRAGRARLIENLTVRDLHVTGTLGYEKAEATAGGVSLAEVNPSTLESRKAEGVYLCGEMLDVDGRLGGFNFQFAWSSGTVAGRAAGQSVL